jgi:ATP/ADP translocase
MPYLLTFDTLPVALVLIPLLTIVATSALYFQQSLFAVFLGFGVFKVLEYSVWYSCMELIWLEVPSQVRPLSKEIVRFLGHKTGKTVVSIGLSMVSSRFKPDLQQQALWCVCLLIGWLFTKYLLAQEVGHKKNKVKKE